MHTQSFFAITVSVILTSFAAALSAGVARGQDIMPRIPVNPLREAYYGELHLHTSYSLDSYLGGLAQVDPDGAYRFARGEPGRYLGEEVRRTTPPLDFAAVTDHAEWLGALNTLDDPDSALSRSTIGQGLRERNVEAVERIGAWPSKIDPIPNVDTNAIIQSTWQRAIEAANRHYQPGRFTTFIAYEWTAMPDAQTLHRNVIFRGDKAPNPFTAADSSRPEELWGFLEKIRRQGYEALAIPHNPNLSNGLMFDWVDSEGKQIDQIYAERRASHEPLVELIQNKGQSETHPMLSPNDEFSSFEIFVGMSSDKNKLNGSYLRDALGRGLSIAQRLGGVNPYQYGFVGGSDFHNGLIESAENAYAGTQGAVDPTKKTVDLEQFWAEAERSKLLPPEVRGPWTRFMYTHSSAALTGVWAEQNTRESIYAALRRKETFATSGTRLKFRFFGGWDFDKTLLKNRDWVKTAYRVGVPMGGDLPPQSGGKKAPKFVVWAVKDPNGANLDRLQVVKVWVEGGEHMEKVHDVALSNGRTIDPKTGKGSPVGNTVDLKTATYTNSIGAVELAAVWQDPQFNPKVPAVYYLRALEIPTPRWSTLVTVKLGKPLPEGFPPTIQERGWSSPIWFNAPKK